MKEDGYFDSRVAETYDENLGQMADPETVNPAVDFLVDLADSGSVLEFGIGTGRMALPLSQRGLSVDGIELSRAMVAKLLEKPNGADTPVVIGDFSTASTGKTYSVVFLLFNTIMNLTTQAAQVACFRNACAHLEPGGHFVVEVMVPRMEAFANDHRCSVFGFSGDEWGIDEYDATTQSLISHHLRFSGDEITRQSIPFRYVWPSELDLMAQLAGMTFVGRWADWKKEPFAHDSTSHVSVWKKAEEN